MKKVKVLLVSAVLVLFSTVLVAQTKWDAPASAKTMKNPVATSDASVKAGQAIYVKTCTPCHGKTGLGDGVKSKSLKVIPTDFTKAAFQAQRDGEHFYKTKAGKGEMPKYEGKLTDNDMWNLVNYMRTFKK